MLVHANEMKKAIRALMVSGYTLGHIAENSGVSKSTLSRIVNERQHVVRKETEQRFYDIFDGYDLPRGMPFKRPRMDADAF